MNKFSIVTALALSLALSATAFADEPTSQPTSQPAGSFDELTATLVGTWHADLSTFETNMFDAMPDNERAQVEAMLAQGVFQLTNNADGTYVTFNRNPATGEEYSETGTWSVVSHVGDQFTVQTNELTDTRGAHEIDAEPDMEAMRFVDDNTLVMTETEDDGGYMSLTIRRQ